MTQLVLNIEQPSVLPILKKLIGIIDGVSIAKPIRRARKALEKKADPTLMTKEEFYAMIDHAKEQVRQGKVSPVFTSVDEMFKYIEAKAV